MPLRFASHETLDNDCRIVHPTLFHLYRKVARYSVDIIPSYRLSQKRHREIAPLRRGFEGIPDDFRPVSCCLLQPSFVCI